MITNRKIRYEYTIVERWNAGIALLGSEVKSLRSGIGSISNAYAVIEGGEVFMVNMDIPEYRFAKERHSPKRKRKLLLKSKEIKKMIRSKDAHYTLVPERVFFSERGYVKVVLALCIGKKSFDKRRSIMEREKVRNMQRIKKTFI